MSLSGLQSPRLSRALALALAGRVQDARLALESLPASGLPPHARPWREWLAQRLAAQATGAEASPAAAGT